MRNYLWEPFLLSCIYPLYFEIFTVIFSITERYLHWFLLPYFFFNFDPNYFIQRYNFMFLLQHIIITIPSNGQFIKIHFPAWFFIFYMQKNASCVISYLQNTMHFVLRFYIQQAGQFPLHFLCKKQCTLFYAYIYIVHGIVLIPNHKCMYDQSNHIDK